MGPTNNQQKPTSSQGEKELETHEENCRKRGSSTFGKLNLVGKISAVIAFKEFQLVVTCLVLVAEISCAGKNSKNQHYAKSVEKKDLPKTWI